MLNVVYEHTREALNITVDRRLDSDATVAVLDRLVPSAAGHPASSAVIRGSELTANALREWCCFSGADTGYIEPGSP